MVDWLFTVLRPAQEYYITWRRHHCRWRAAKFRPMLGAQGLWAGRDLYRATPAVTRGLSFSGLIRRTAPFSRLLQHTRGCGGSILAQILTGTLYGVNASPTERDIPCVSHDQYIGFRWHKFCVNCWLTVAPLTNVICLCTVCYDISVICAIVTQIYPCHIYNI
jgi:hypothetical protein